MEPKIKAKIVDNHILTILDGEKEIRIYFADAWAAISTLETLLKSEDVEQG